MGYRDTETALRLRVEQLEQQVAQIPALQEQLRLLAQDNARWRSEADRLRLELAALRPALQPATPVPPAGGVSGRVLFSIPQPSGVNRVVGFDQPVIKIGRNPQCHLVLEGDDVSRMHAVVEIDGTDVSIIDLGSTTGTQVNGRKINKQTLSPGDRVRIGRYEMIVGINR
jgi:pSer/pThr/pTyr-binding forkhead associated (FHA) protein